MLSTKKRNLVQFKGFSQYYSVYPFEFYYKHMVSSLGLLMYVKKVIS